LWAAAALASAAAAVWLVPADLFGWRLPFTSSRPGAPEAPALPASAVNSAPPGFAGSAAEVASAPAWSALPAAPADVADSAVPAASTAREASSPAPMAAPAEVMAANPAASVPAGTPSSPVQLRSTESSWIEVRDGQGKLLVSRTLLAGENLGFDGQLPLRLTIGNAAATRLGFRGQPVDLAPLTRENVARVELR
jgi:cytoskeleton protein RodZ